MCITNTYQPVIRKPNVGNLDTGGIPRKKIEKKTNLILLNNNNARQR